MTGSATKIDAECACTASQASTVAPSTRQRDGWGPAASTAAIASFTSATASGGFQIVALNARSNGDVAPASTIASPSTNDPSRDQIAMSSTPSASD